MRPGYFVIAGRILLCRALAVDEAGNISLPSDIVVYAVDRTKPSAPYDISIHATAGYIELTWKYSVQQDFYYFKLWRAESPDGIYEVITPSKYQYTGYLDREVEMGKTYYYKVTVVDIANNESEPSEIMAARLTEDKIAPSIYFTEPLMGDILNSKAFFSFIVYDDLALKSMRAEYQYEEEGTGNGDDNWHIMASRDYNPDGLKKISHAKEAFYWENQGLPEGWYKVRIIVEDSAGNVTGPLVMRYLVKNVPPPKPVITAEAGMAG